MQESTDILNLQQQTKEGAIYCRNLIIIRQSVFQKIFSNKHEKNLSITIVNQSNSAMKDYENIKTGDVYQDIVNDLEKRFDRSK